MRANSALNSKPQGSLAAAPMAANRHICILGGGVSGLSTAYYLSNLIKVSSISDSTRITLLESSSRFGGWIESHKTSLPSNTNNDEIILERGPRTLRPSGIAGAITLDLVHRLGLSSHISPIPKTSPASRNRFIYYKSCINPLPSSALSLLTSYKVPALSGFVKSTILEPFQPRSSHTDESIHEFISRRFGPNVANRLMSALTHGIYAGDSHRLSIKSCFRSLYEYEKAYGSIVLGMVRAPKAEVDLESICDGDTDRMQFIKNVQTDASIYTFKGGMQELSATLVGELRKRENIDVRLGVGCKKIDIGDDSVEVALSNSTSLKPTTLISTVPTHVLQSIVPVSVSTKLTPFITKIPYVSVSVINLLYRSSTMLPYTGFGYLIPPGENEMILGVIFDSCSIDPPPPYTKLTVMIGGHLFDKSSKEYSDEQLVDVALDGLKRHLGIEKKPEVVVSETQRQCIPQYLVGHDERVQGLRAVVEREWGRGRIVLSGAGLNGVGVGINDCIKSARDVAVKVFGGFN
ncbi:protoporphyrinogen oxidase [Synchytrium endobioticum]|uniref:Protoporphyrinogen oxidase n=1 Tax=Synchytrium endobioticum TaxID=286115 RepID=A0A507CTN3_9FUNG|nr:protoporphyrinogen oxidase [Synchytrium endobioticum]TPX43860.1 protoporphyrinogen oxidase [Synchytrium endobioticum]